MADINVIMQYATYGLALIGVLAFLVGIVVQTIKEMPVLSGLPTTAVALAVSLTLCPVTLVALLAYYKQPVTWYNIFACIIASFVVYLVATGGWDKVREIWDRTKYNKKDQGGK